MLKKIDFSLSYDEVIRTFEENGKELKIKMRIEKIEKIKKIMENENK